MTTACVTHADCLLNDIGPGHPECPDRLASVNESMRTSGLVTELRCLEAPSAEPLDLKRVHHGAYVDLIFENAPAEGRATPCGTTSGLCWLPAVYVPSFMPHFRLPRRLPLIN